MVLVIQYLELATDGRPFTLVEVGVDKVLDAAVGSFGDPEINCQHKIPVGSCGYDITPIGRLTTVTLVHLENAIFHRPSFVGERVELGTTPSFTALAIPQKFPSFGSLSLGYGIGYLVDLLHLGI